MFKVNNKATKTTRRFGGFIVNFEHISRLCSSVSIVNSEHVIAGWEHWRTFSPDLDDLYNKNILEHLSLATDLARTCKNIWSFLYYGIVFWHSY